MAWFGIRVNTFANSRTAFASLGGKAYPCYAIPLKAGISIGMLLISVELLIMLIILMFILSVPASFVAGAIAVGVAFSFERLMHSPLHTTRLEMLFTWGLFFAAGYIQWLTLLPRAWSKWQMRKSAHSEGPELKRSDLA